MEALMKVVVVVVSLALALSYAHAETGTATYYTPPYVREYIKTILFSLFSSVYD